MAKTLTKQNEKQALLAKLTQTFGATYSVVHGSSPFATVVEHKLVSQNAVKLDTRTKEVVFQIDAYSGEKGNTVFLRVPLAGLKLILSKFESEEQTSRLLNSFNLPS